MFFYSAKLIWMLLQPLTLFTLLLVIFAMAYAVTYRRIFARILFATVALFALIGVAPLGHNMLVALETQHKRPELGENEAIDGIIVLGGALRTQLSRHYGYPVINASGSRLSEFVHLLHRFPDAKAVFTGGSGDPFNQDISEAEDARAFIQRISPSIGTQRLVFEGESRNTFQNAVKSYKHIQPAADSTWALITSAYHMPRAMAVFRSQGWSEEIIAYPVDHRTDGQYKLLPNPNVQGNFEKLTIALHEYVGYIVYDLTDRL